MRNQLVAILPYQAVRRNCLKEVQAGIQQVDAPRSVWHPGTLSQQLHLGLYDGTGCICEVDRVGSQPSILCQRRLQGSDGRAGIEAVTTIRDSSRRPASRTRDSSRRPARRPGDSSRRPARRTGDSSRRPARRPGDSSRRPARRTGDSSRRPARRTGGSSRRSARCSGSSRRPANSVGGTSRSPTQTITRTWHPAEKASTQTGKLDPKR